MKLFHHSQLGAPQKEKKSGALGTCPVCPLVKTALSYISRHNNPFHTRLLMLSLSLCVAYSAIIVKMFFLVYYATQLIDMHTFVLI